MNMKLKRLLGLDKPKRLAASLLVVATLHFIFPRYRISTGSMRPTMNPGDIVVAFRGAYWFGEPEVGDIVVFRSVNKGDDTPWTHRVIAVGGDTFAPPKQKGRVDLYKDKNLRGKFKTDSAITIPDG